MSFLSPFLLLQLLSFTLDWVYSRFVAWIAGASRDPWSWLIAAMAVSAVAVVSMRDNRKYPHGSRRQRGFNLSPLPRGSWSGTSAMNAERESRVVVRREGKSTIYSRVPPYIMTAGVDLLEHRFRNLMIICSRCSRMSALANAVDSVAGDILCFHCSTR